MIRIIEESDIGQVLELVKEFKKESFNKTHAYIEEAAIRQRIIQSVETGDPIVFVALQDGKIVGIIAGILSTAYADFNKKIGIELIWIVNKNYRGGSVGTRLFKTLEDKLFELGADSVIFTAGNYSVQTNNSHLLEKMYRRNGYEKLEVQYIKQRRI